MATKMGTFQSDEELPSDDVLIEGTIEPLEHFREVLPGERFLFTSAQNNTYLHEGFWKLLNYYAGKQKARVVVGTYTYMKNGYQNGTKGADQDGVWFDERLSRYIVDQSRWIGKTNAIWCGELNILPTAVYPALQIRSFSQGAHAIVPHAKCQMESVARPLGFAPQFVWTTGTVTQRNYIQKLSGQKASFHHVYGALYVEVLDDGTLDARQIIANDDGSFTDLNEHYFLDGRGSCRRARSQPLALVVGDLHSEQLDAGSFAATLRHTVDLRPEHIVLHDVLDFTARNPHERDNPFARVAGNKRPVLADPRFNIQTAGRVLQALHSTALRGSHIHVVRSNHDDMLDRWVRDADWKQDTKNAEFLLDLQREAVRRIAENPEIGAIQFHPNLFSFALQLAMPDVDWRGLIASGRFHFLELDEPFSLGGVDLGHHGHTGTSGGRGTISGYVATGRKLIAADKHTPTIRNGAWFVGTNSRLDMAYVKGFTTWAFGNVLLHRTGKRQMLLR